ncbi:hypothetical protein GGR50DRAFT_175672 [Xylaria sp. CBS 124048]|nr:hypothetical protein GGR50DRAFT_175672 [Xylaria sp. CBS 124048]
MAESRAPEDPPHMDTNGGQHMMSSIGPPGQPTGLSFNAPDAPHGGGNGREPGFGQIPLDVGNSHATTDSRTPHRNVPAYQNTHNHKPWFPYPPSESKEPFDSRDSQTGQQGPSNGLGGGSHERLSTELSGESSTGRLDGLISTTGSYTHSSANNRHASSTPEPGEDHKSKKSRYKGCFTPQSGGQASATGSSDEPRDDHGRLERDEDSGDRSNGVHGEGRGDGQITAATGNADPISIKNPNSSSDLGTFPRSRENSSDNERDTLSAPSGSHSSALNGGGLATQDITHTGNGGHLTLPNSSHDVPGTLIGHQSQETAAMSSLGAAAVHQNNLSNSATATATLPAHEAVIVETTQSFQAPVLPNLSSITQAVLPPATPAPPPAPPLLVPVPPGPGPGPVGFGAALLNLNFFEQFPVALQPRDQLVVCVVCGGVCKPTQHFDRRGTGIPSWMLPTLVRAKEGYVEWLKTRDVPSNRLRSLDVMNEINVTAFEGGSQGMKLNRKTVPIDTREPLMNIPIHKTCLTLAERFFRSPAGYEVTFSHPSGGAPNNMWHLYEIWCKRAIATCSKGLMDKPILEANMYFGAPIFDTLTKCLDQMDKDRSLDRFLACPVDIPNLTDMLVSYRLRPLGGKETVAADDLSGLHGRLQGMPQEIFDRIIDHMEPFDGAKPPLEPTRVLPASLWKKELFSGSLFPWLWDLKEEDLTKYRINTFYKRNPEDGYRDHRNGARCFDENKWDWERLCRQLAQPSLLEENNYWGGRSKRIWNRRRIWKLLEAARLGHVLFRPMKLN